MTAIVLNWRRRYAIAPSWIAEAISIIVGVPGLGREHATHQVEARRQIARSAVSAEKMSSAHSVAPELEDLVAAFGREDVHRGVDLLAGQLAVSRWLRCVEAPWRPNRRTVRAPSRASQSSQRRRGPKLETSPGLSGRFMTWYGTEVTTVPLRNSSRPFRNSALWLCRSWPHQEPTTNSGITTVTMSLSALRVELVHEPQHRPGELPVGRVDDLERDVDPVVRPVAGDLLLLVLVGDDGDREQPVGPQRLRVRQRLQHAAVHAAHQHHHRVVHRARPVVGRGLQTLLRPPCSGRWIDLNNRMMNGITTIGTQAPLGELRDGDDDQDDARSSPSPTPLSHDVALPPRLPLLLVVAHHARPARA